MKSRAYLLAVFLLLDLLVPSRVQAMPIRDFARMNLDDEATYVANLVEGAAKSLRSQGQPEQAQKLIAFFKDSSKGGGVNQLAQNMKATDALNNRNAINPNNRAPLYEVEDAMAQTLNDNGIHVSAKLLLTINRDFRPMGPPRSRTAGP